MRVLAIRGERVLLSRPVDFPRTPRRLPPPPSKPKFADLSEAMVQVDDSVAWLVSKAGSEKMRIAVAALKAKVLLSRWSRIDLPAAVEIRHHAAPPS